MTTAVYKRLDASPEPSGSEQKKSTLPPIALDKLESDAKEIRLRSVNFRDFYTNKIIGDAEYRFAEAYQKCDEMGRKDCVVTDTAQCVATFTAMITNILTDKNLQYILTWLGDILAVEQLLITFTTAANLSTVIRPLLSILFRNDNYSKYQANMIIAKLAFASKEMISLDDLNQYMRWYTTHLSAQPTEYYLSLSKALQYFLRRDCYRIPFYNANGVKEILKVLGNRIDFQQQYQLVFSLWMLTFNETVVNKMKQQPIVVELSDVLRGTEKEKVRRIILATLRNLLEKPEKTVVDSFASQMIHFKVLRVLNILIKQQWIDKEIEEDVNFLHEQLTLSEQDLSSFDEYVHEVRSGRLEWSPVHRSEKFWRENVTRFNENDYEILRLLVSILEESASPVAVSVACYDIGEYVRYYPRGKKVIDKLNGKEVVMRFVVHTNSEVRMQALLAVQKMMVQNWEYLGKQLKGTSS